MEHSEDKSLGSEHFPVCGNQGGVFATTQWSMVLAAGNGEVAEAAKALEQLCISYWYPIYAFVRRRGVQPQEAEDLTQTFFAHLLEKEALKRVDRTRGKFRTFLLASLTNFLNNEWDKLRTLKRGGQCQIISLDETTAEECYHNEPVDLATPEKLFERRWALTLLEQVLARLKQEYTAKGNAELFVKLESLITGEITPGQYVRLAGDLSMTEEAIRMAVSRMRRRFGELLRQEIGQTVTSPAEVDEEIRHLFAAIAS